MNQLHKQLGFSKARIAAWTCGTTRQLDTTCLFPLFSPHHCCSVSHFHIRSDVFLLFLIFYSQYLVIYYNHKKESIWRLINVINLHSYKSRLREIAEQCKDLQKSLTFFSIERLLQQKTVHTFPVLQEVCCTVPHAVHKICSMFMQLKREQINYYSLSVIKFILENLPWYKVFVSVGSCLWHKKKRKEKRENSAACVAQQKPLPQLT